MGSICSFFTGRRKCGKRPNRCEDPRYDKWFRAACSGRVKRFPLSANLRLLNVVGVPFFLFHCDKRRIVGEAVISNTIRHGDPCFRAFKKFIKYPTYVDPSRIETDDRLTRLSRTIGGWQAYYIHESTVDEIRRLSGLRSSLLEQLDATLAKTKVEIERTAPLSRKVVARPSIDGKKELRKLGLELGVPRRVVENATLMFEKVAERHKISRKRLACATLLLASRAAGIPMTARQISQQVGENPRRILHPYRALIQKSDLRIPIISPSAYVQAYSHKLHVSKEALKRALELASHLKERTKQYSKSPISIAAASLYVAIQEAGRTVDFNQIANAFGISTLTVKNTLRALKLA